MTGTKLNYEMGSIVDLDPMGMRGIHRATIVGRIEWIDGTVGYVVSSYSSHHERQVRHMVSPYEIELVEAP